MLIPRQLINLPPEHESQLMNHVWEIWRNGYSLSKVREWANCSDAYHLIFRKPLSDSASYLNDYRQFYPIARTLCDVGTLSMTAYMIPSTKYLSVKRALVGEFITNAILQNFAETNWVSDTDETVFQAGQAGDTFTIAIPMGPYIRFKPISLHDIRFAPLDKDLNNVTKVLLLRKTTWDMERSEIPYIQESVQELKSLYIGTQDYKHGTITQNNKNPYSMADDTTLGTGMTMLEAQIPFYQCQDGTEYKDVIVTITSKERKLLRFSQQLAGVNNNNIWKVGWQRVGPGDFWAEGIIFPCLGPNAAMNTLHTAQTFGALITNMNGIQYNYNDKLTRQLAEKWVARPLAKWPVNGTQSGLAPLPIAEKGLSIERTLGMMQQYITDMVDGRGGNNLASPFAIDKNSAVSQQRIALGQTRAAQIAKHWDKDYTRECAYRSYKHMYHQCFPDGTLEGANVQSIMFWLKKSGLPDKIVMEKINDHEFMEEFSIPPELTEIEATGTQSQIDKEEQSNNLITLNRELAQTPSGQFVKWDRMGRRIAETLGLQNVDDLFFNQEEVNQLQQMQQQQAQAQQAQGQPGEPDSVNQDQVQQLVNIIESRTNPSTNEPLTDDQINELKHAFQEMTGQSYDQADNQEQEQPQMMQQEQQVA